MAKIRDQEEQKRALKNINGSIKDLEAANEFLKQENKSGKYSITFTGEDGKKYTADIALENKDDINQLVLIHKEAEKKRIEDLAEANGIALDPEDHEVLDFMLQ